MKLKFSVSFIVEIPNQPFTAKLVSVHNSIDEDITTRFLHFCSQQNLPLTSQREIEKASNDFGRANRNI